MTRRLDNSLLEHRLGDFHEAGDVGALHVVIVPCSSIAWATFMKPAMLAPLT